MSQSQNSQPKQFLEHLKHQARFHGLNVDHVVPFFSKTHMGLKTVTEMGPWIAVNSMATFAEFSMEFLRRYPGKPPQVTRLT